MADIAIISMLYESIGVMSVYDTMYLYQFVYLPSKPFLKFLQSFAFQTSIIMKIEWLFTNVSLVIETRYQNMAVVAVWRNRWKQYLLVAVFNAVPLALWSSAYLVEIMHKRFRHEGHPCKMPFT